MTISIDTILDRVLVKLWHADRWKRADNNIVANSFRRDARALMELVSDDAEPNCQFNFLTVVLVVPVDWSQRLKARVPEFKEPAPVTSLFTKKEPEDV